MGGGRRRGERERANGVGCAVCVWFPFSVSVCGVPVVRGLCAVSCDVVLIDCRLIEGMKVGKM